MTKNSSGFRVGKGLMLVSGPELGLGKCMEEY